MDLESFQKVVHIQMEECLGLLTVKGEEYATDQDRLDAFKRAAKLEGISVQQALSGMMAKHTVSIYDLCSARDFVPYSRWHEKITDHINYLLLLKAIIVEQDEESMSKPIQSMAARDRDHHA